MKKLLIILTLLFTASLSYAQKAGDVVTFTSTEFGGDEITSEIFTKNKITMLNIWGTFCPPCIREMPGLAKLAQENKGKGVEVVGVIIDLTDSKGKILPKQLADAGKIIELTGADYRHIIPSIEMQNGILRNIQAVPSTIFVDKNGVIIDQMYLGARSQKDWQRIIDKLLAKQ